MTNAQTSRKASAFIQREGLNTLQEWLDCSTIEEIEETKGGRELILCFDALGNYISKGATKSGPEMISYTVENLLTKNQSTFEKLKKCNFALYINQRDCGRADDPDNFVRQLVLTDNDLETITYAGLKVRDEDQVSMLNLGINAIPPAFVHLALEALKMTTTEAQSANDIAVNLDAECGVDCAETYEPGEKAVIGCDAVGAGTANALYTSDEGVTWVAATTDPLAADDDIMAVTRIDKGNGVTRVVYAVDETSVSGGQGKISYTDDDSLTAATVVNIGGATAGHGVAKGGTLYYNENTKTLWLATAGGYIYKSTDEGVTWTAMESGVLTTDSYAYITFDPTGKYGVAVSDSDVISITNNGGDSWSAATATGAGNNIKCAARLSKNEIWVGDSGGRIYYSTDGGTTWTRRTGFDVDGTGTIIDMSWLGNHTCFMAHNTSGPVGTVYRSTNGGKTFKAITTPTNSGLNRIVAVKPDLVYAVGEAHSSLAMIIKVSP